MNTVSSSADQLEKDLPEKGLPENIPMLAVLGFASTDDCDWDRIQLLQQEEMPRSIMPRIVINALGAVMLVLTIVWTAQPLLLAGWIVTLAVAMVYFYAQCDALWPG